MYRSEHPLTSYVHAILASSNVHFAAALVIATGLFIVVEIALKHAADSGELLSFAVAMVFSMLANALYLFIIKQSGLSTGFVLSSIALTFGVVIAGCLLFGETWTFRKSVAVALLVSATALLALPESSTR